MHVIFSIWQCPDVQVIAIHAFHKIFKMPDFEVKTKIFWWVLSIHDGDLCKLYNSASNLKQVK